MKCYSLRLATLITVIVGSSCWAEQNRSGGIGGHQGTPFGSGGSPLKAIGSLRGGNGSPIVRSNLFGNGAQVFGNRSAAGRSQTCNSGSGLVPLAQCPRCGDTFRGTHACDRNGVGQNLPLTIANPAEASATAALVQAKKTSTDDPAKLDLDKIGDQFADSDLGRFNLEVRDPLSLDFRVVKSDLSRGQADRLGDQLSDAFWVVSRGDGLNPTKRMAENRVAAQELVRQLATDSPGSQPVIESIAYRIVSAAAPTQETPALANLVESALEDPAPYSDKPDPTVAKNRHPSRIFSLTPLANPNRLKSGRASAKGLTVDRKSSHCV